VTIPKGFLFNQSNLQDYVDCQRRFQLRYLLHQAWPAVEAEPFLAFEHRIEQGSRFHKIIYQHLTGIPESQIEQSLSDDGELETWWMNYHQSLVDGILGNILQKGKKHFVELTLSIPLGEFRLVAKYDLLVIMPDQRLYIFDWKTSKIRPKQKWLANRLQTHVYQYVLTNAVGSITDGGTSKPEQVEMIYWFTNQPDQPEQFKYNLPTFEADKKYLENLVHAIYENSDSVYPLTLNKLHCKFCNYRSLCNRGIKSGELRELEDWQESGLPSEEIHLDYEQIGEIEF
jgi:CRISPR/Cas system-associated exonuclease Cas4 (RecB family)